MRVNWDDLEYSDDGLLLEWHGVPLTGIAFETGEGGRLVCEVAFQGGQRHGLAQEWSPSGSIRCEEHYYLGAKHGFSRFWFDNGQLKTETIYELGVKTRECDWNAQGTLIREFELRETDPLYHTLELLRRAYPHANSKK
jgi:antitoxin component YwqK of YwqJK toxin-antitoxin module